MKNTYMFQVRHYDKGSLRCIGVSVGVTEAETLEEAETRVRAEYESETTQFGITWLAEPKEGNEYIMTAYTVYRTDFM